MRFTQPVLDTLLLDAVVHPDHDEHSLEAIAGRLGVAVLGRHTALGDALVTGEVFLRLITLLQQRGIGTLGAAVAASRATLDRPAGPRRRTTPDRLGHPLRVRERLRVRRRNFRFP